MFRNLLLFVLAVCAGIAGVLYLGDGGPDLLTPAEPASPQQALLNASQGKPGDPDLGVLFDDLNARHFSGVLPKAKVLWEPDLERLDGSDYRQNGMTDGKTILLNAGLADDEAEMRRTLCHEMVHVKLLSGGNRSTAHDALFQGELRRVFDEGCFEAIWATPEERTALGAEIDAERARLDAARASLETEKSALDLESVRVEQLFRELNERIARANAAGSGWPSAEETQFAQAQRTALNDRIQAYNRAVEATDGELARFNDIVRRYNLMMAYPDGLAEDRARELIR